AYVGELLRLRRQHLVPRLAGPRGGGRFACEGALLRVEWTLGDGSRWRLLANFGSGDAESQANAGTPVYTAGVKELSAGRLRLAPGAVRFTLEAARG
ncbi:MAG TPA: DUF3459 domain-containing protein, partial [Burkholderiales bacterium]|nr:DUF3459 domain-containing protein [Burkholderiales bacterium]